jgi:hypothetical protein
MVLAMELEPNKKNSLNHFLSICHSVLVGIVQFGLYKYSNGWKREKLEPPKKLGPNKIIQKIPLIPYRVLALLISISSPIFNYL